jgi:hypothetical protein
MLIVSMPYTALPHKRRMPKQLVFVCVCGPPKKRKSPKEEKKSANFKEGVPIFVVVGERKVHLPVFAKCDQNSKYSF